MSDKTPCPKCGAEHAWTEGNVVHFSCHSERVYGELRRQSLLCLNREQAEQIAKLRADIASLKIQYSQYAQIFRDCLEKVLAYDPVNPVPPSVPPSSLTTDH